MDVQKTDNDIHLRCSVEELKEIYRALFQALRSSEQDQFDESDLLMDLQLFLQRMAREDGVDATIHMEWEKFLGYERLIPCDERYADYTPGTAS